MNKTNTICNQDGLEDDIYFELSDKSGELMRNGICKKSFLEKLRTWAESIGGNYYTEAIC